MPSMAYHAVMTTTVEYTDEFGDWWGDLSEAQQVDVAAVDQLQEEKGPKLPFPLSSGIKQSRHSRMRELRIQSGGKPLRVFYAFDLRRQAIFLIGGDKTGRDRFYVKMVPRADDLYDEYLDELRKEGVIR